MPGARQTLHPLCCLIVGAVCAVVAVPSRGQQPDEFARVARPLLQAYCFKCHGDGSKKGDVELGGFTDSASVRRQPRLWRTVLEQLNDRLMPPEGKAQPSADERAKLIATIHDVLASPGGAAGAQRDPGKVTARRLSRAEYNNTIRDLLGVETNPADIFPADGGGGGGFDNNADTLFVPPVLMENYLRAAAESLEQAERELIFATRPGGNVTEDDAARESIRAFASKAFRRPANSDEVNRLFALYAGARQRGDAWEKSVKLALKAALASPQFLFRIEREENAKEPWRIGNYELASRLSYFIWASTPDEQLLKLAGEGKLHDDTMLEAQVRRMLKDPRSKSLGEEFGGQWLKFKDLKTSAQPDRQRFRNYTFALRDAMYDEAVLFVDSVFREDQSLLTLLDADYTFANEVLARHYGIPDVKGEDLRKVKLPAGSPRGGVLGLGSVLTVTSYPLRTSPVLRGRWVLDEILGSPPPPPPPDAGELPQDDAQTDGLSFRQRLEEHRKRPECASCHNRMDPIGFGLENFDPIGRWRTESAGKPVDAAGVLVSGERFSGPGELKKILLTTRKDAFTRNVTEKMLAYALGRGLEHYDEPTIAAICKALAEDEHKASRLVLEIVRSCPFQYRRK